jgi:hypothetical protein
MDLDFRSTGSNPLDLNFGGSVSVTGQVKVWNGSAFIAKPAKVWDGASFITKPVKVWDGAIWATTNY